MALPELDRILSNKRTEALFLASSCAIALVYRGWGLFSTIASGIPVTSHISYDGVYYAQIARNILCGEGLGREAMIFPVLQPIVVAAISYATGIDNMALLANYANLMAGVVLVVPAYFLAKEYFGVRAAAATVLILLPYPHLVAISNGDTVESIYALMVVVSLLASYRALVNRTGAYMFLAGAILGLTYLARPEGLNIFIVFLGIAAWRILGEGGRMSAAARMLGLALAGFLLFALPYMVFLTNSYGRVVLSSKLPYESVAMKYKVLGEQLNMFEVEGLTPDGRMVWEEKGGAGLVFGYFRDDPGKFLKAYTSNFISELPWMVRNSSHLEGYPIVYPLYFWLPALLGFWLLARDRQTMWKALLLWAPFSNMFVYPVFTNGFWMYHVPYASLLVILAAGGYLHVSGRIKSLTGRAVPLLLVVAVIWVGYSAYVRFTTKPENVAIISYRKVLSDEAMKVGDEMRRKLGPDTVYMMRWSRLVYYLGGRWLNMPADDPVKVAEYGRRNNADYIVEELTGEMVRYDPYFQGIPGLRLVHMYDSPVTPFIVIFWEIEKEGLRGSAE